MKQAAKEDLDKALYIWFVQKRCQEFPLSGIMIMERVLIMNRQLDGSENL